MMNEPLSTIMTTRLITVTPDDSLQTVRDIFLSSRVHHIPVIEDDELVGLVTTYDLFRLSPSPEEYRTMQVSEVMTTRLATLEPEEKIGAAAEVFLENLFHAIPIVRGKKLLGMVSSFDVLKYEFAKAYPRHVLESA